VTHLLQAPHPKDPQSTAALSQCSAALTKAAECLTRLRLLLDCRLCNFDEIKNATRPSSADHCISLFPGCNNLGPACGAKKLESHVEAEPPLAKGHVPGVSGKKGLSTTRLSPFSLGPRLSANYIVCSVPLQLQIGNVVDTVSSSFGSFELKFIFLFLRQLKGRDPIRSTRTPGPVQRWMNLKILRLLSQSPCSSTGNVTEETEKSFEEKLPNIASRTARS
jgi:hypothetical protein